MMSKILVSALLLCSAVCVLEITANCPYECICERTFSYCLGWTSHTAPPTGISPPTIDLNTAKILPGGVLPGNLAQVNLQECPIASIADDAFDESAKTLTSISIMNCPLTRVPDALLHLHSLNYLSLADTRIVDWNANVMNGIGPHVTSLVLSNTGLTIWPSWMQSFTNLTQLSFEGSLVSSIPDDAFDIMNGLTSLSLDNNKLSMVPKALSRVATLQTLGINGNIILDITWLPKLSALTSLSLGGNRLSNSTYLSNALLPFVNSLIDVDFNGNRLTSIPDLGFLINVDMLDFSNNMLSNTNAATFPAKLNFLDLSSNLFSSIPSFMFTLQLVTALTLTSNRVTAIKETDIAPQIQNVNLDKNLITELTDTSFPRDSRITSLVLDYNPLTRITVSAFKNLSNLTNLSLRNSRLTRLPLALALLTKLTFLDVYGSQNLVCTCMEKGLHNWVMNMSVWSINGDCGQTSVYFFFATLSPGCPEI
ncbi:hypothetical protein BsWGS_23796 [Bradybaena similaris]